MTNETFSTPEPVTVEFDLSYADTDIIASDRDTTIVTVSPGHSGRSQDEKVARDAQVTYVNGVVRVHTAKNWGILFGPTSKARVTVEIPAGSSVRGATGAGYLHGTGVLNEVEFKTGAGDIELDTVNQAQLRSSAGNISANRIVARGELISSVGTVRVQHVAGAVDIKNPNSQTHVGDVTGRLNVKAGYSDVRVERVAGDVTVRSAHGGVEIGCAESGSLNIDGGYGSVEVCIPEGTVAWLDVQSANGSVRNDLESSAAPTDSESRIEVHVTTNYGKVRIRRPYASLLQRG